MPDSKAKLAWERENVININVKINRNQDPELYRILSEAESRGGKIRELLRLALKTLEE